MTLLPTAVPETSLVRQTTMYRTQQGTKANHLPALFVTPTPQPRKRMSEVIADIREAQAAKRARTATNTPDQSVGPPRPTVEDVEDQGDEETDQPDYRGHNAVNNQPDDQIQITANAAGNKTEAGPSRVMQDPPRGSRNAQSGKSKVLMETLTYSDLT